MPENGRKPDSASSRAGYGGARLMERVRAECMLRYEREVLPGMLYAVIETGGKQVKVTEGEVVFLEKLEAEESANVTFDKVLLCGDENGVNIGVPYVNGAKVEAKVVKNGKGRKVTIFKYNAKKNYRKKQGHRQPYTKVQIEKIIVA